MIHSSFYCPGHLRSLSAALFSFLLSVPLLVPAVAQPEQSSWSVKFPVSFWSPPGFYSSLTLGVKVFFLLCEYLFLLPSVFVFFLQGKGRPQRVEQIYFCLLTPSFLPSFLRPMVDQNTCLVLTKMPVR